ncbi:MAG: TonB-dependent receptor, partial [Thiomicrorhabdus sp.]|nr:TonB-dependent receptor [Thiomicrorhabdus sp.]
FKDKITGKIGLKNYFTSDVYIGGQFATAYNAPSIYAYANALDKLQPESIEGYELNIGAYGFEASIYNNEVANLIDYTSGWPSYAYNLDGTSELKGYELSYAKYLSLISSYVSLSFEELSAKNSEQQWLGRRPENQAKLDINYDGFKNTVIGVQSRYIGKMYDQNNQQGQQIGEYWLTDVNVNYNLNKDFTLYGRINNILDESYIPAVANYDSSTGLATHVYNSAGRQFFIGLRGKL